jgi:hypothetical protein
MKLKEKIKKWLFAEELQEIKEIESAVNDSLKRYEQAEKSLIEAHFRYNGAETLANSARELVGRMVDVGVDVHRQNEYSWAVICIDGKPDYVKFIPLNRQDARSVMEFLKTFEYSKHTIDSPIAFQGMIKDWFL